MEMADETGGKKTKTKKTRRREEEKKRRRDRGERRGRTRGAVLSLRSCREKKGRES